MACTGKSGLSVILRALRNLLEEYNYVARFCRKLIIFFIFFVYRVANQHSFISSPILPLIMIIHTSTLTMIMRPLNSTYILFRMSILFCVKLKQPPIFSTDISLNIEVILLQQNSGTVRTNWSQKGFRHEIVSLRSIQNQL